MRREIKGTIEVFNTPRVASKPSFQLGFINVQCGKV